MEKTAFNDTNTQGADLSKVQAAEAAAPETGATGGPETGTADGPKTGSAEAAAAPKGTQPAKKKVRGGHLRDLLNYSDRF